MRPLVPLLALVLALPAAAEERYVPIAAGTELRIVNPSPQRASVTIETFGGETVRLDVDAGATMHWAATTDEGVLRVDGDAALQVTASSRRNGAHASLPIVAARQSPGEAEIVRRSPWRSGVLAVNPNDATASVTIDDVTHAIAPHGVLRVDDAALVRAHAPLLLFACDANDATGARVFTPITPHAMTRKRRAVRSATHLPAIQTVVLTPSKDNTLYESNDGAVSNGAGIHLFIGTTRFTDKRRALLAFDVAGQIPPGSRITRASLTMHVTKTISGAQTATLHRVTKDWGESTSNAGDFGGGGGDTRAPGDATWIHTFAPDSRWTTAGGDFESPADAASSVATESGLWESPAMLARVQQWLDQPAANFGWILIGNESNSRTAKRLASGEIDTPETRPSLTIEYER